MINALMCRATVLVLVTLWFLPPKNGPLRMFVRAVVEIVKSPSPAFSGHRLTISQFIGRNNSVRLQHAVENMTVPTSCPVFGCLRCNGFITCQSVSQSVGNHSGWLELEAAGFVVGRVELATQANCQEAD